MTSRHLNQKPARIPVVTKKALAEDETVKDSVGAVQMADQQQLPRAQVLTKHMSAEKHSAHQRQAVSGRTQMALTTARMVGGKR